MKRMVTLIVLCGLAGCAATPDPASSVSDPDSEVLMIYSDGTMEYRKRILPEDDVIIYDDGFGGERAAVKMYVPLKNDYYRDSIRVVREPEGIPGKKD